MKFHPALAQLSRAALALSQARTLPEVKNIIDLAEAAKVYIQGAKIGEDAARHAEEIKLRAQRKAGGILSTLQKGKAGRPQKNYGQAVPNSSKYQQAIADAGIEKKSAQRYQQVAAIPEKKFESYLEEAKGSKVEATTAGLLKEAKHDKKRQTKVEAVARIQEEIPAPQGPFRVIVIDPPWKYESRAEDESHRARNPYPSMTQEQIVAMPVQDLAHEHCIVWLWTTNAFIRDAFACLDAWGFQQKTILTWVKDRMGLGDWLRGQTEHCVMAVRGKPVVSLTNQTTALIAPLREHSRKPDEFYSLVEALCPGNKLEMFSRQPRDGWRQWGAETNRFAAA